MGMLDKKRYLTGGDDPFAQPGDLLRVFNARVAGQVTVGGETRDEVKLLVSREDDDEQTVVFTSGTAIVSQVKQMDQGDVAAMRSGGLLVKLGTKATNKGNPMNLFVDPTGPTDVTNDPSVGPAGGDDDIPF